MNASDSLASTALDWEFLFQDVLCCAKYQINRLRWRHEIGGVLPEGFDANSLASQAILDFLQQPAISTDPILRQIKRHVLRQVTRLHHLKENGIVINEADLTLVSEDGELINPILLIPNPATPPDEALIEKESYLQYYDVKSRFEVFLGKERRLKTLFKLRCDGLHKPQALASHLKLGPRRIENLQKRLQRKWLAFATNETSAIPLKKPYESTSLSC